MNFAPLKWPYLPSTAGGFGGSVKCAGLPSPSGASLRERQNEASPSFCRRSVPPPLIVMEELLNRITAIRAAAEILDDNRDLEAAERATFLAIIRGEVRRMQHLIGAMTT